MTARGEAGPDGQERPRARLAFRMHPPAVCGERGRCRWLATARAAPGLPAGPAAALSGGTASTDAAPVTFQSVRGRWRRTDRSAKPLLVHSGRHGLRPAVDPSPAAGCSSAQRHSDVGHVPASPAPADFRAGRRRFAGTAAAVPAETCLVRPSTSASAGRRALFRRRSPRCFRGRRVAREAGRPPPRRLGRSVAHRNPALTMGPPPAPGPLLTGGGAGTCPSALGLGRGAAYAVAAGGPRASARPLVFSAERPDAVPRGGTGPRYTPKRPVGVGRFGGGGVPAVSYSPTRWPAQYHRR